MLRPLSCGHFQGSENKSTNIIKIWINHSTVELFIHVLILFIFLFDIYTTVHPDIFL